MVLEINCSYFIENSGSEGGVINMQQHGNLSLRNCTFESNFASYTGGAIASSVNVTLEIRETNFTGNSASRAGGALYASQSRSHVLVCVFHSNTAKTAGAAVFIQSQSSLQIEHTNFTNNNSSNGGAIYIQQNSYLHANICRLWKNFANEAGGAIDMNGYSKAVIETCYFLANHVVAGSGGAINFNNPEHLSVRVTFFQRNVASGDGGAIAITGGSKNTINNITCVGNYGGCLFLGYVTLILNVSEINENVGQHLSAGVTAVHSELQVGN